MRAIRIVRRIAWVVLAVIVSASIGVGLVLAITWDIESMGYKTGNYQKRENITVLIRKVDICQETSISESEYTGSHPVMWAISPALITLKIPSFSMWDGIAKANRLIHTHFAVFCRLPNRDTETYYAVLESEQGVMAFGATYPDYIGDLDVRKELTRNLVKLTPSETNVLNLLIQGMTTNEICEALVVKPGTVKNHIQRACMKTGSANRVQLVVWAIREKVVSIGLPDSPME